MTEETIDFTVVIPVYNGAAYIADAVNSCLQQSLLPKQIIIVDDASTDNTTAIIQQLTDKRIVYRRNEKNSGPSYTRNIGIQMATTSWISFLDADDTFHPKKLEVIQYCIGLNNDIRAIGHAFDLKETKKKPVDEDWKDKLRSISYLTAKDVVWKNPMVTPSLSVAADNVILFDESMVYAEDHDFILRTAEQFGICYVDLPLCSLQRKPLTPGGISSNKWKMRVGEMRMYISYAKRHNNYLMIPLLIVFSLLKHLKNILLHR